MGKTLRLFTITFTFSFRRKGPLQEWKSKIDSHQKHAEQTLHIHA